MGTTEEAELRGENDRLKMEVEVLRQKLSFFEKYKTLAEGTRGEKLVGFLIGATQTSHKSSFDLETKDGLKIEVKTARLNHQGSTGRWVWSQITGMTGKKEFDFLVLCGEADPRYINAYASPIDPYVFFIFDSKEANAYCRGGGVRKYIQITSNPNSKNINESNKNIYSRHMISAEDLTSRFHFIGVNPPAAPASARS